MLSDLKKNVVYFAVIFVVSLFTSFMVSDVPRAQVILLVVSGISGGCLVYVLLEMTLGKKRQDIKWPTKITLVPDEGAIYVFGKDQRPEADEIVKMVSFLRENGIDYFDLTIFGKKASCAFWGDDLLCPFETTISNTLCISNGKFYRVSNQDPNSLEELERISYLYLSELHQALKAYVSKI